MKEIEILFTHIFIGIFLSSIQCLYLKKPNLSKVNLQTKYPFPNDILKQRIQP